MVFLASLLTLLLHAALLLGTAPLLTGVLGGWRARLQGRIGPPVLQPYRDLARLLRKQPVVAEGASVLFVSAPVAYAATVVAAALLVPSFAVGMASAGLSDLLLLAGLLGAGRAVLALAGWDAGTAFGGMGAVRGALVSVFAGPALLLAIFALFLLTGTTNLDAAVSLLREGQVGLRVSLALALGAAGLVALADNNRVPVDSPSTRQELAMLQGATTLEYSGRHLALLEYAAGLRLLLWLSLIAAVFLPLGMAPAGLEPLAWLLGLCAWAAKLAGLAAVLTVFEALTARMRVFRVPEFLGVAVLLGLLAVAFLFVSQGFV